MSVPAAAQRPSRQRVTAVVVAHNGMPWLDELVAGVGEQIRLPDHLVAVDTGSGDGSRDLLAEVFGQSAVLDLPTGTGFGAAVDAAVRQTAGRPDAPDVADEVEWLWLLHDDCAPEPQALEALLALAEDEPDAAVIGPKLRGWPAERRLLEVGVSITGSGNRETGLEFNEYDQGQHDEVRQVLAVSTAGMLVRRDVYEELGGFDPRLPLFRDDVDFGWRVSAAGHEVLVCPDAVVHHAEAGHRRARALHAVSGPPRRVDRRNAIYTLLVNTTGWLLPLVAVRLVVGSLLRSVALLVVKWPDAAYDEAAGMAGALANPGAILQARRRRRHSRVARPRAVRSLLPPPWIGLQRAVEALAAVLAARTGTHAGSARRGRAVVETGPVPDEAEDLAGENWGVLRWLLARPVVVTVVLLALLAVVAARELLGDGVLRGGALLPAPDGMSVLWQRYVETWHPVDLGSGRAAPTYLPVVAALSVLVLGKVWLLVDLVVLGAVPLAGLTAAVFLRHVARSRVVRVWAVACYALVPAVSGAVAGGRFGACVALVALPLLALAARRAVGDLATGGAARAGSWPAVFGTGVVLAAIAAFVPLVWVGAAVVTVAGGVLAAVTVGRRPAPSPRASRRPARPPRRWGLLGRAATVVGVAALLHLPWLGEIAAHPTLLLGEAGSWAAPGPTVAAPAWMLALGQPGGPGTAPWWLFAAVVVAALAALVRADRVPGVATGWMVALTGLVLAVVQSRLDVSASWLPVPAPAWPGLATGLCLAGMLAAAAHGADGLVGRFTTTSFSWRQPVAGVLAAAAALTPLVGVGWWVWRGVADPLTRGPATVLPEYVVEAQAGPDRPRALVLRGDREDHLGYALTGAAGQRLGDAETGSGSDVRARFDDRVADLVTGATRGIVDDLATVGVRFVYLPAGAGAGVGRRGAWNGAVVEALDATPGLVRAAAPDGAHMWQVDRPVGRVRVVAVDTESAAGAAGAAAGSPTLDGATARVLESGADGTTWADVPAGAGSRVLAVAEAAAPGWRAWLDGAPLTPVDASDDATGAQAGGLGTVAFELPPNGGHLRLEHVDRTHTMLLGVQGGLAVLFLVLAVPSRARREPPPPPVPARRRQGAGVAPPTSRDRLTVADRSTDTTDATASTEVVR